MDTFSILEIVAIIAIVIGGYGVFFSKKDIDPKDETTRVIYNNNGGKSKKNKKFRKGKSSKK